ncbi:hypothetical protein CONPUDRAFT_35316, partial [Coniophora puteana RWD-64-598 SS2]
AHIKPPTFLVITEFVPTSFEPSLKDRLEEVLISAGMPTSAITWAEWIKRVSKRKPGQQTAHLKMVFTSTATANRAIEEGLMIEGHRVYSWKSLPEPPWCFKCQSTTGAHLAATCLAAEWTCASCAGPHCTNQC